MTINLPATFQPNVLAAQMQYAEALAASSLLPKQYQRQPANLLWAISYGQTLGIEPMTAVQGIHVINGRPTASADLIAGLVRRAGHKLRVSGDDKRAVAQIIRADDPDFTFEAVWTIERANAAKLTGKDTWKQFPAAMLRARAVTEVARAACSEILHGTIYTPEELGANVDADGIPADAEVRQLRRVQPGETDPWQTPAPGQEPTPQWVETAIRISEDAEKATALAKIRKLYREANAAGLLTATVLVKLGGNEKSMELGAFLVARSEELAAKGPSKPESTEGVIDAEVVEEPVDERAAAIAELMAAAKQAGVTDSVADDFYGSYGLPIAEAHVSNIREMANLLRGAA